MFKKIFSMTVLAAVAISSFLAANNYEIQDIGTLQTHSSKAIAINDNGQILGWYNVDGTQNGKKFFIRDKDGILHDLPQKEQNG